MTSDLSHLPPSTAEEIRVMVEKAGLDLPDELMAQFIAAWPAYEAMVRRIPRRRTYAEEPAHVFRPERLAANRRHLSEPAQLGIATQAPPTDMMRRHS